jgi:hypothetical protein
MARKIQMVRYLLRKESRFFSEPLLVMPSPFYSVVDDTFAI